MLALLRLLLVPLVLCGGSLPSGATVSSGKSSQEEIAAALPAGAAALANRDGGEGLKLSKGSGGTPIATSPYHHHRTPDREADAVHPPVSWPILAPLILRRHLSTVVLLL